MKGTKCNVPEAGVSTLITRRSLLGRLIGIAAGALSLSVLSACPGGSKWRLAKLQQPGGQGQLGNLLCFDLRALRLQTYMEFQAAGRPACLIRTETAGQERILAMSRRCPHSGCTVAYYSAYDRFICPCHGSKFDQTGARVSGPARRGMTNYRVTIQGDVVTVDSSQQFTSN